MKHSPLSFRGAILGAFVLVVLQFTLAHLLAHARLLEHLLSPGSGSNAALAVTGAFLLLRVGVLVLLPGWVLAQLWLWATRTKQPE